MITCTRKLYFDAGHRVPKHESKCKYLHGHRYTVEATFTADDLDEIGRVIDFGSVYTILGKWLDENFDHNVILHECDKKLGDDIENYTKQKIFYLPYHPTAENIAKFLLNDICPKLFTKNDGVKCIKIRVDETPNCYAEVSLN